MELEGEKEMNDWLNKPWVIRVISLFLAILTFLVISFDNQDTRSADVGSFDYIFNNSVKLILNVLANTFILIKDGLRSPRSIIPM